MDLSRHKANLLSMLPEAERFLQCSCWQTWSTKPKKKKQNYPHGFQQPCIAVVQRQEQLLQRRCFECDTSRCQQCQQPFPESPVSPGQDGDLLVLITQLRGTSHGGRQEESSFPSAFPSSILWQGSAKSPRAAARFTAAVSACCVGIRGSSWTCVLLPYVSG